jgi:hypothetical protein
MAETVRGRSKFFPGWFFFWAILVLLAGIEFCYFLPDGTSLKRYAAFTWIVISVGFLMVVVAGAFRIFFENSFWRDHDKVWFLIAFFLPVALVYFDIGGIAWTPINDEGTQQLAQGVDLLKHDPNFGVFRLAYFVGYDDRQYLLAGLPTYFFGPSLVALRFGNSAIYLGSYLVFLTALAGYLRANGASRPLLLAGFAGTMVALGEYPLVQARVFEQTTMPIGATLLFLAGVLSFLARPAPFRTFWIAWSFAFFAEGYTPALGGGVFALCVLLYLALHPRHRHRILLVPVAYGLDCLMFVCLTMNSVGALKPRFRLGPSGFTFHDWVWRYFMGYHTLLSADWSVIPCPLALASLAVLYFSLRFRDYRFVALVTWALVMVFASLACVGSFFNLAQFDVHRAIFILPPLALGVVLFYHVYRARLEADAGGDRTILFCAQLAMTIMIYTSLAIPMSVRTYIYHRELNDYDEALYLIDCANWNPAMKKVAKVYIVPPLDIADLETGLTYFSPEAVVVRGAPPPGEKEPGAYVLSYVSSDENDRLYNPIIPSRHPRPYLQLKPE